MKEDSESSDLPFVLSKLCLSLADLGTHQKSFLNLFKAVNIYRVPVMGQLHCETQRSLQR